MRRELIHDSIDLSIIHLSCNILWEQKEIEDRVITSYLALDLLFLALSVINGSCSILIFLYFVREDFKGFSSYFSVLFILIVVFKESISHRILFSFRFKGWENHISKLCHVINLVRSIHNRSKL